MDFEHLTGRRTQHLSKIELQNGTFLLQADLHKDFYSWQKNLQPFGLELAIASAHRSFERQLLIWNEKIEGKRPLYNKEGQQITAKELSDKELLNAVLLWSHIPGCSRHHWGTDLDVYDESKYAEHEKLDLSSKEYSQGGKNFLLTKKTEQLIWTQKCSFFKPYEHAGPFIQQELWHYSHQVAKVHQLKFTFSVFKKNLLASKSTMHLCKLLLSDAKKYYNSLI
jgi:LAS superfamily LD-carboxypeptidase LdcB